MDIYTLEGRVATGDEFTFHEEEFVIGVVSTDQEADDILASLLYQLDDIIENVKLWESDSGLDIFLSVRDIQIPRFAIERFVRAQEGQREMIFWKTLRRVNDFPITR